MKADKVEKRLAKLQKLADKFNLTIVAVENPIANTKNYLLIDFTTNGGAEVATWSALESLDEVENWLSDFEN